jgi:hypothetical protein
MREKLSERIKFIKERLKGQIAKGMKLPITDNKVHKNFEEQLATQNINFRKQEKVESPEDGESMEEHQQFTQDIMAFLDDYYDVILLVDN